MDTVNDLVVEDLGHIGHGTYGTVRKARYKNEIVAIKIFDKGPSNKIETDFIKEAQQLRRLSHTNIIQIIRCGKYKDKTGRFDAIIMEYAEMGSLHTLLHVNKDRDYTFRHAINWLYQTASAVSYLHSTKPKAIIHRDLKPMNLLLKNGGLLLKICDFGTSCDQKTLMSACRGTTLYMAPELISDTNYNEKCDVFSFGITMWEIFTRQKPYFDSPNLSSLQILLKVKDGFKPPLISSCPSLFNLLYEKTTDKNSENRPNMAQILDIIEKLNFIFNINSLRPIIEFTPVTPKTDHLFSFLSCSSESLQSQRSVCNTAVRKPSILVSPTSDISNNSNFDVTDFEDAECVLTRDAKRLSLHFSKVPISNNNKNTNYTFNNTSNSNSKTHRRTRSHGNPNFNKYDYSEDLITTSNPSTFEDLIKPTEPIDPIEKDAHSMQIYRDHVNLVNEHRIVQEKIKELEIKKIELMNILKNQNLYSDLQKQKQLLEQDTNELEKKLLNGYH